MPPRRDALGAAAIDMVVLFPVTLLMVFAIVQFGVWYHASDVAKAAAQEGVRAARVDGGTAQSGADRATQVLDENARSIIGQRQVTPFRDNNVARVVVAGRCVRILPIPGLALPVHAVAESPVERFRPPAPMVGP
jgi:Flp pilus assembly protein TadG